VGAEDGDEAEDGIVGEDCGVEDGHRSCAPHVIGGSISIRFLLLHNVVTITPRATLCRWWDMFVNLI
jgi:hypothetical protein